MKKQNTGRIPTIHLTLLIRQTSLVPQYTQKCKIGRRRPFQIMETSVRSRFLPQIHKSTKRVLLSSSGAKAVALIYGHLCNNLHHGAHHAVYTYVFVVEAFCGVTLSHDTATFPAFGFFVRVLVSWTLLFSVMAEFRCKYVIVYQRFVVARYL